MKEIKQYRFNLAGYSEDLKCYAQDIACNAPEIEEFPVYRDGFYTFILVESGTTSLRVNGHHQQVGPYSIICGLPGELWEWPKGVGIRGKIICFEAEFLLSMLKDPLSISRFSFLDKDTHYPFIQLSEKTFLWIRDIIIEIIDGISPHARNFDLMKAQLWHLLLLIEKEYETNDKPDADVTSTNIATAFVDLVHAKLYRHHNVAYFADRLCVTPDYLNKIVHKSLGQSASCYIQSRLMAEAKVLLKGTLLNINEIALTLGFESANYFIRFFRKHTGVTPGDFRKA